jgi:hypothetical protein
MSEAERVKFEKYHAENPHVYTEFEKFANLAALHRPHFSARAIIHKMRWETMVGGSGHFKIQDHVSPYYARLFEQNNPRLKGFFRKKHGV